MSLEMAKCRRQAFEALLLVALGPKLAAQASWSRAGIPTLNEVSVLRRLLVAACLNADALLHNDSAPTALELAHGNWRPVIDTLAAATDGLASLDASADAFDREVAPMGNAPGTRRKHWAGWRTVLTWAATRDGALARIFPMDITTLKALLWDALSFGTSQSVMKGLCSAIQARHHEAGLPPSITGPNAFTRMMKALARFQGRQSLWLYPIHKTVVARLLRHDATDPHHWRDLLAAATATVACLRPNEGAALQVCDLWVAWDALSYAGDFEGTAALNISSRKNDQCRKGHHPRFGRAVDPALDIVYQLQAYMGAAQLAAAPTCTKRAEPSARCQHCPPLFPMSRPKHQGFELQKFPLPSTFSAMILCGLRLLGMDTSAFSGVCARRGGLSTAISAGVPESILWMQSGHAQDKAARRYVQLTDTTQLYATFEAFGL